MTTHLIQSGQEWTFELIEEIFAHIEDVAKNDFNLKTYTNQLEVISSEQMLDAYTAVGMPVMYPHWSFGQSFVQQIEAYRRGHMGLAYEIVINSDPCIAYLMEENTMLMQTLVMAHASFGHNHFFKNNYLFKQWTDADGIIDYLGFAKKYITQCEEKHGVDAVEAILDAAHALQQYGVDKYQRPAPLSAAKEEALRQEREAYNQSQRNELWNTIPRTKETTISEEDRFPSEPQENILYFLEKNAPRLEQWQREIIRIVRRVAQYFYPQGQTQLMNEGFATYTHYKIMHKLQERGLISDGAMLEFYHSHTGVVMQPDYNDKRFSQLNPYALGFAMMMDIERVVLDPTQEDRDWFGPAATWVGSGKVNETIQFAAANFKDESFVQQYLTPKIIRDFKLFAIHDDEKDPQLEVAGIHDKAGYKTVREALSKQYNYGHRVPDIQVYNVDRWGDRSMTIRHYMVNRRPLHSASATETMKHLAYLWGYPVSLESVDAAGEVRSTISVGDGETTLDIFLDDN